MLKQYFGLKEQYPQCLMLFRVGDFYEAYGEDAEIVSKDLNILLTKKDCGDNQKIPMAGVPHHSVKPYLRNLIKHGHKVAIAEQMEDPKTVKGLVKREVVEVLTQGSVLDDALLEENKNNFIAALLLEGEKGGIAAADLSTGEFYLTGFSAPREKFIEEVLRWEPAEILLSRNSEPLAALKAGLEKEKIALHGDLVAPELYEAEKILKSVFKLPSLLGSGLEDYPQAFRIAALLLGYLQDLRKTGDLNFSRLCTYSAADYLVLDHTTTRHLELTRTLLSEKKEGSLLWALDETCTPMGGRLLRQWLERPLKNREEIQKRHLAVKELAENYKWLNQIREQFKDIRDLERLLARITFGSANARDLKSFGNSLLPLGEVQSLLVQARNPLFKELFIDFDALGDLKDLLFNALSEDPPLTVKEGGMIKKGYHAELDELRGLKQSAQSGIAAIEAREKERTGIKSLKVGYNQVFGYYIEVTRANLAQVPEDFIRKQTLANAERFISPELKEYESKVLGAQDKINELEYRLFQELREKVISRADSVKNTSRVIAWMDVLADFAYLAHRYRYVMPELSGENILEIREGRHPVVERKLENGFVPNDLKIDGDEARFLIVTGPNMAGKSTYLRQAALTVIMAQMGCFVPAKSALLGMVDRVFTRVGATDDLHLGQSTFMVEMMETANILNSATPQSLVILDEVGRGTSTFDGLALAWAVAEFLYEKVKAKALFATHFYELNQLEKRYPGIANLRVLVREDRDEVIFLHKIVPGGADRSYGIYVAKLAGIPDPVLNRAQELLEKLQDDKKLRNQVATQQADQLSLITPAPSSPVLEEIEQTNIMELTPLQALNLIHEWQKQIRQGN